MPDRILIIAIMLLVLMNPISAQEVDRDSSWLTRSGDFRVSYMSRLDPVTINRIHDWVIHIENAQGEPVNGVTISVTGGMPLHNHGLPTSPKMTQALGNGDYLLAGLRFHMSGYWELTVVVEANGRRDPVVIPLTI